MNKKKAVQRKMSTKSLAGPGTKLVSALKGTGYGVRAVLSHKAGGDVDAVLAEVARVTDKGPCVYVIRSKDLNVCYVGSARHKEGPQVRIAAHFKGHSTGSANLQKLVGLDLEIIIIMKEGVANKGQGRY